MLGANDFEQNSNGPLEWHICSVEKGDSSAILVAGQTKVCWEAGDLRVSNVAPVVNLLAVCESACSS